VCVRSSNQQNLVRFRVSFQAVTRGQSTGRPIFFLKRGSSIRNQSEDAGRKGVRGVESYNESSAESQTEQCRDDDAISAAANRGVLKENRRGGTIRRLTVKSKQGNVFHG